jgi:hypothetical protein
MSFSLLGQVHPDYLRSTGGSIYRVNPLITSIYQGIKTIRVSLALYAKVLDLIRMSESTGRSIELLL